MSEPKHIRFVDSGYSSSGKTKIWNIVSKEGNSKLGEIRWFGAWRCYAHFITIKIMMELIATKNELVFERICLRDIADFCEKQTKLHNIKGDV